MADGGGVDIASLTEEQQLALQQFTSVTDQDLGAAIPLLRSCEWNVQIAIARFFDGEPAPIPDDTPAVPPPQPTRRQDTLASGFSSPLTARNTASGSYEPAPRVSAQSESRIVHRPPFLLSILLTPANLLYSLVARVFGLFSYLFPFLPRLLTRFTLRSSTPSSQRNAGGRRPLGPQDTTARFLREFEEEYGAHALPFLETGYSRAFDLAKRELKFLVVIPMSTEHDDTSPFVRDILLSEPALAFFNDASNNILLWGGSVEDSEAYQVAASLNITKFPTAVIIAHTPSVSSTAMSVVGRVTAPASPQDFIAGIQAVISQHSAALGRARAAKAEQDASRNLREQQNSAYERSLAQDRERAKKKREAEAKRAKEEMEQREREEKARNYTANLAQWRQWRASSLPKEPGPEVTEATRISLRLLNGERIMRKFHSDADIEEVYALVECWDYVNQEDGESEKAPIEPYGFTHKYEFRLVSPLPRKELEIADGSSVGEIIGRSGNLIVERIEPDEETS